MSQGVPVASASGTVITMTNTWQRQFNIEKGSLWFKFSVKFMVSAPRVELR